MIAEEFTKYWEQNYPETLPVAHELKRVYKEQWLRIHALPNSKRYPENIEEYQEIFRRHNTILSDLFEESRKFILMTTLHSLEAKPPQKHPKLDSVVGNSETFMSLTRQQFSGSDSDYYAHLYISRRNWLEGSLNGLLKLIVDDEVNNVLLVSTEKNFIYHPYDGGADIILLSQSQRDSLKERYSGWLSKHPDGF